MRSPLATIPWTSTAGTMGVTSGHLELSVVDALSLHAMGRLLVTGVTGAAK